ncbi:MAG: type VII toxin-antitoxin system MntA family adenylyltransferase antitoxin [Syntrophobacteria bacterium]
MTEPAEPEETSRLRKEIIDTLKRVFDAEPDVLFSYIFGSMAGGMVHFGSDIDVAVYLSPGGRSYYHRKDEELRRRLVDELQMDVDLFLLNVSPLILRRNVIIEGEKLTVRDAQAKVDFETATLVDFFEKAPYFDLYHSLQEEKIRHEP